MIAPRRTFARAIEEEDTMTTAAHDTERASHGLFHMENSGGCREAPALVPEVVPAAMPAPVAETNGHQPSCFGLEEERGEGWHGSGASRPLIKDTRPTL
jgi:hypothetical protein